MILVIDVGNTNIVLGVFDGATLVKSWRMTTGLNRTADEVGTFILSLFQNATIDVQQVENVVISSVVPDIMYSITHAIKKYFKRSPFIIDSSIHTGITVCMANPKELGADRLVNCAGAYHLYGGPLLVIDYGTATTYDVITADGRFITGITAPGIRISADALFTRAALLGKVELEVPPSTLVTNTISSVQAGIVFSHIGATEYIINRLKKELNEDTLKVVATGGLSKLIAAGSDMLEIINPILTLEGLRILYELNR